MRPCSKYDGFQRNANCSIGLRCYRVREFPMEWRVDGGMAAIELQGSLPPPSPPHGLYPPSPCRQAALVRTLRRSVLILLLGRPVGRIIPVARLEGQVVRSSYAVRFALVACAKSMSGSLACLRCCLMQSSPMVNGWSKVQMSPCELRWCQLKRSCTQSERSRHPLKRTCPKREVCSALHCVQKQ